MGGSRMGSYKHPRGENNSPRDCSKTDWKCGFEKLCSRLAMKNLLTVRVLLSKSCISIIIFQYHILLDRLSLSLPLQWAHSCILVPADGSRVFAFFFCIFFKTVKSLVKAWVIECSKSLIVKIIYMFKNQCFLFELSPNDCSCFEQCFCVWKYTILCLFCNLTFWHYFVANNTCRTNEKNEKNKARTTLLRKRASKGNAEWYCGHDDANYATFRVSCFCTLFAVSCVHVVANKTCTYTKSGKTR